MLYKYIVTLFVLCSALALQSQELPYSLTILTGFGYAPLTDADTLDTDGPWDDPAASIPIGFDFPFFGENIDILYLNGFVGAFLMSTASESEMMIPYGADLADRGWGTTTSQSPILYKIDREAPKRILKIEWQNAGFYNEQLNGINESFVNFQLWLYETNGTIEYCYGPSNIAEENDVFIGPRSGPVVGLSDGADSFSGITGNSWLLLGDPASPDLTLIEDFSSVDTSLVNTPATGTIYQFIVMDVSAVNQEELSLGVVVYPNPVSDQLQLEVDLESVPDQLEIRLFNALGQEVYYQDLAQATQTQISISVKHLPKGMYTLQLRDGKQQTSKTIIKS